MADSQQVEAKARVRSVLEDPSAEVIARTYAEAFVNAAQSVGVENALEEFDSFLTDVLRQYPEFESILLSEFVKPDQKVAMIDRVVSGRGSEFFQNFLCVLARHGRLNLLPVILHESRLRHEAQTGRRRVKVTAASELSEERRHQIYEQLNGALPFQPILEFVTDQSLIGGLVIRIGDTVYDTSLRTRVRQLRDQLRERNLNEIQSRRDRFSHPEGD